MNLTQPHTHISTHAAHDIYIFVSIDEMIDSFKFLMPFGRFDAVTWWCELHGKFNRSVALIEFNTYEWIYNVINWNWNLLTFRHILTANVYIYEQRKTERDDADVDSISWTFSTINKHTQRPFVYVWCVYGSTIFRNRILCVVFVFVAHIVVMRECRTRTETNT